MAIEDTKKYFEGFPEAPASDSFKWVDPQGFEHLTTIRAWHIKPLLNTYVEAQIAILELGGKPISSQQKVTPAPVTQIQEKVDGLPVTDPDGNPSMINLPPGTALYSIKGFYHGKNKAGDKDFLCVVVNEKPHNGKYGHKVFHPPFSDWKAWQVAGDPPGLFSVPGYGHVVIRDAAEGEKYPEIVDLRP